MKRALLPTLLGSFLIAAIAQAHTHLEKAMPADGSVLKSAPKEVMLHFSAAARVTSLTIQKGDEAKRRLGPLPEKASAMVSVPVAALAPGKYVVSYRVVSGDNHVMSGDIHFTIDPTAAGTTPAPSGAMPEHHH